MAAQNKFYDFVTQVWAAKHDFTSHVFKWMLTNSAPVATNTIKSNITDITAGNGYTAGGTATTISQSNTTGTLTVQGTQVVFLAAGGAIGPFRYLVLYNDTQASPVKPLVSWVDYGSALTLNDTDSLTVKFNSASPGTIHTVA